MFLFKDNSFSLRSLFSKHAFSFLFFLIIFLFSLSFFLNSYALEASDVVSRYPWVDSYKYIKQDSSVTQREKDLDSKVQSLKNKIEQSLAQKNKAAKKNQDLILVPLLSDAEKEKLSKDISYVKSNLNYLGPNLKVLFLQRLKEFQSLSNPKKKLQFQN